MVSGIKASGLDRTHTQVHLTGPDARARVPRSAPDGRRKHNWPPEERQGRRLQCGPPIAAPMWLPTETCGRGVVSDCEDGDEAGTISSSSGHPLPHKRTSRSFTGA